MARELSKSNPSNAELRLSVALALTGRADAYALLGRKGPTTLRRDDLSSAERDYAEAAAIMAQLEEEGAIEGTDRQTFERIRTDLDRVRRELAAGR
jgi:hypothetical protein